MRFESRFDLGQSPTIFFTFCNRLSMLTLLSGSARVSLHSAATVFLASAICSTTQAQTVRLKPLRYPNVAGVQVVEGHPKGFGNLDGVSDENGIMGREWPLTLRFQQHPEAFEKLAEFYNAGGYTDRPPRPTLSYHTLVQEFCRYQFLSGTKLPWTNFRLNEFQKAKAFETFYRQNSEVIRSRRVNFPLRIGKAVEVRLTGYDESQGGFQIHKRVAFGDLSNDVNEFEYRFDQPVVPFGVLSMTRGESEDLLRRLPDRTIHAMVSFELTSIEPNAQGPAGVVANLRDQRFDFFIPGKYERPFRTRAIGSLLSAPKASTEQSGSLENDPNSFIAQKMEQLCRELRLFQIDGVPVVGSLANLGLPEHLRQAAEDGQQRLGDRMALASFPTLLDPKATWENDRFPIDCYVRLLGGTTMRAYLNDRQRDWRGEDVFQTNATKQRFFAEQGKRLRSMQVSQPLRLRTFVPMRLDEYDFDNQQFNFDRGSDKPYQLLQFSIDDVNPSNWMRQPKSLGLYSVPSAWKLPAGEAKEVYRKTLVGRKDERFLFQSVVFDVTDQISALTTGIYGAAAPTRYIVQPSSAELYFDSLGTQKAKDLRLTTPSAAMFNGPDSDVVPRSNDLFLWQPELQVALLELAGHTPTSTDWINAAMSIHREDTLYYRTGTFLPYDGIEFQRSRQHQQIQNDNLQRNGVLQWSNSFQPYFPTGLLGNEIGSSNHLQLQTMEKTLVDKIRSWMRSRIKRSGGEFRLGVSVEFDHESGLGKIVVDAPMSESSLFSRKLPKAADYGMVRAIRLPQGMFGLDSSRDRKMHEFSIAFPAIEERMQFEFDPASFPQKLETMRDQVSGVLVVRLEKIDVPPVSNANVNSAVIHVKPIRFEFAQPESSQSTNTVAVSFTLPVSVDPYTMADQAEEKRERANQLERERELEKLKAQRERQESQAQQEWKEEEKVLRDRESSQEERQALWDEKEGWRIKYLDAEEARVRTASNLLICEGYFSDQIDWSTGTVKPGAEPMATPDGSASIPETTETTNDSVQMNAPPSGRDFRWWYSLPIVFLGYLAGKRQQSRSRVIHGDGIDG